MTETNVTSPTGIQEIDRFDGLCLEATVWDVLDARVHAARAEIIPALNRS